jgi:hypothetical protein
MKPDRSSNHTRLFDLALFFIFLLFTASLALTQHYSHSELWAITTSQYFFNNSGHTMFIYAKPLFHGLLSLFYALPLNDVAHIQWARGLFAFIGALNLWLIYQIATSQLQRRSASLWFTGFILSFHVVFTQCFRVRSDWFSFSFFLILLYFLLNPRPQGRAPQKTDRLIPLLILFSFLATPKAIYLISMGALLYLIQSPLNRRRLKNAVLYFVVPVGLTLSLATLTGELIFSQFGALTFALHYYIQSFSTQWLLSPFVAVQQTLVVNSLQCFVIVTGLFYCGKNIKSGNNKKYLLITTLAISFILIHPERWEFFLATMVPLLCLPLLTLLNVKKYRRWLYGLSPALVVLPLWLTYGETWLVTNKHQQRAIADLAELTKFFPEESYFDSTGALPRQSFFPFYFDENNPASNQNSQEKARIAKPGLVFLTAKMQIGGGRLLTFLLENYKDRGGGFWLRKDLIKQDSPIYYGPPLNQIFNYSHRPYVRGLSPRPSGLN